MLGPLHWLCLQCHDMLKWNDGLVQLLKYYTIVIIWKKMVGRGNWVVGGRRLILWNYIINNVNNFKKILN